MILTVDIGNTNIKVGAWDADKLVFVSRMHTNTKSTADEYAVQILDIFMLHSCNSTQFDGAIISSVVPPLSGTLKTAVERVIHSKRVLLVSPGLKTGLNIKIDDPSTLGADIVCASVAAIAKLELPCILISMGTATAMGYIDKDGAFNGGSVSPGVFISLEALAQRTAQLPHISIEDPTEIIGTNTIACMKSGIIYGTASMIDGMILRMREAVGEDNISVYAFGGLASGIVGHCREEVIVEEDLVLEGLRILFHKNMKTYL